MTESNLEADPGDFTETVDRSRQHLLFVDDEPSILNALRRLFLPLGYKIHLAESGAKALEIIKIFNIDLIICDMRMPQMSGTEFLEIAAQDSPDTVRILLTGQADKAQTIEAINRGRIHRYFAKPWDDQELALAVERELSIHELRKEKNQLLVLSEAQNFELQELNSELQQFNNELEQRVKARTSELQQTADMLELSNKQLTESYLNTIRVFASLVGMRESLSGRYTKQVADLAKKIAELKGLEEYDTEQIYMAALLHEAGKLALPDSVVDRPPYSLDRKSRGQYRRHPVMGQQALTPVESLHNVGKLIRCHEEKWDGSGFPDGLHKESIPVGARIIGIANDYYGLISGRLSREQVTSKQAVNLIKQMAGTLYDPEIVPLLDKAVDFHEPNLLQASERKCTTAQLSKGMRLSRDLYSSADMLLLTKRRTLTLPLIEKLKSIEKTEDIPLEIYVYEEVAP